MSASDERIDVSESSFWLELERAAKALSVTESKLDAERLRSMLEDLKRTQRLGGKEGKGV